MIYDVIIIGSGPAGLTASIYACRAELNAVVIEKNIVSGGQILDTFEVDNYPGFPHVSGVDLAEKFKAHSETLGAQFISGEVMQIELEGDIKSVLLDDGNKLEAYSIILAAGAKCRKLNIPGEEKLLGLGVSYCATCDGAFFKNKEVAVIGGGDTALEEALFLSRICRKVVLIHRRDRFRATLSLVTKVKETDNIECVFYGEVTKINGEDMVQGVCVKDIRTEEEREIFVNGVFVAIGREPYSEVVRNQLQMDKEGYIVTDENCKTNIRGVYAAGDIRQKALRQVITAAADGAISVTAVEQYLHNRQR